MTTEDRERLGALLVRRRVQLDSRYSNRRVFARERGIGYQIAFRAENPKINATFETATKALIENAYDLAAGAYDRMAAGGDLEPNAPADGAPPGPDAHLEPEDQELEDIVMLWPQLSLEQRRALHTMVTSATGAGNSPPAAAARPEPVQRRPA